MKTDSTHILRMRCGVTVTMKLIEATGEFSCLWNPSPPFRPSVFKRICSEYEPWRNKIFEDWSARNGRKVIIISQK